MKLYHCRSQMYGQPCSTEGSDNYRRRCFYFSALLLVDLIATPPPFPLHNIALLCSAKRSMEETDTNFVCSSSPSPGPCNIVAKADDFHTNQPFRVEVTIVVARNKPHKNTSPAGRINHGQDTWMYTSCNSAGPTTCVAFGPCRIWLVIDVATASIVTRTTY